jgi:hypothetical protein
VNPAVAPTRAERDRIVDQLRDAVSAGFLTVDEFEERLDAAYASGTHSELDSLIANLPQPKAAPEKRMTRRKWGILAGTAAAVVAFTAFAIVEVAPPSTPHVSLVRDVNACSLLSTAQIESVLGTTRFEPPNRYGSSYGWDECTHLTGGGGPAVTVQAGTALSQFAVRYKISNRDLPGIGNQAAVTIYPSGTTILARRGTEWVEVAVEYVPSNQAMADAEVLAKSALDRLTSE